MQERQAKKVREEAVVPSVFITTLLLSKAHSHLIQRLNLPSRQDYDFNLLHVFPPTMTGRSVNGNLCVYV